MNTHPSGYLCIRLDLPSSQVFLGAEFAAPASTSGVNLIQRPTVRFLWCWCAVALPGACAACGVNTVASIMRRRCPTACARWQQPPKTAGTAHSASSTRTATVRGKGLHSTQPHRANDFSQGCRRFSLRKFRSSLRCMGCVHFWTHLCVQVASVCGNLIAQSKYGEIP